MMTEEAKQLADHTIIVEIDYFSTELKGKYLIAKVKELPFIFYAIYSEYYDSVLAMIRCHHNVTTLEKHQDYHDAISIIFEQEHEVYPQKVTDNDNDLKLFDWHNPIVKNSKAEELYTEGKYKYKSEVMENNQPLFCAARNYLNNWN